MTNWGGDDSPLADAIIDRIAHDSYRINITRIDYCPVLCTDLLYNFIHDINFLKTL